MFRKFGKLSNNLQKNQFPQWFRDAIVAWYDPLRQGCTNENMAENPILKDLSGNGLHMTCQNFAWNTESGITEDGGIIFDGVDDSCIIKSTFVEESFKDDFTIISDLQALSIPPSTLYSVPISNGAPEGNGAFVFEQFRKSSQLMTNWVYVAENGFSPFDEYINSGRRIDYLTSETFNGQPVKRGNSKSSSYLQLGTEFPNQRFWNGVIYSALFFNRTLTEEEIDYVIKKLVYNQSLFSRIMDSCVAWYSPKRQGCTNESLATDNILRDLSGNGRNITLYNFAYTENSGIKDGDKLVLDGVDDYGIMANSPQLEEDATFIMKFSNTGGVNHNKFLFGENPALKPFHLFPRIDMATNTTFYNVSTNINSDTKEEVVGVYRKWEYSVNDIIFNLNNNPNYTPSSEITFKLGKSDVWQGVYTGGYLKSLLIFDRRLTNIEIEIVKNYFLD